MSWPLVKLSDVCEFKYGKSLPAAKRQSGAIEVFGSNGPVGYHCEALTQGPTIVIGRKGSFGEVNFSSRPCWPIDTTYFVDHSATKADLRWLYHLLRRLGLNQMNRAAAVPGLNREDAYRKPISLPPLEEQRRIAAVLDQAEELRVKRRAAIALLDQLPQAIFLEMFGDLGQNSNDYPVKTMIELVARDRPITYGILMPGTDMPGGIPYVRVVDMKDGGIDLSGIRHTTQKISDAYRRSLLEPGDLLMSIRGHVGRLAVVPPELAGANITQDTARLAIRGAIPAFVRESMRTPTYQRWMAQRTKGMAVKGLNLSDVKLIPIVVPPIELQLQFASRVEAVHHSKAVHQSALALLDTLCHSLQANMFVSKSE